MVLKLGCPSCSKVYRLSDPLPPEGKKYRCTCGTILVVTYPPQVRELLSQRGIAVTDASPAAAPDDSPPPEDTAAQPPPAPTAPPAPSGPETDEPQDTDEPPAPGIPEHAAMPSPAPPTPTDADARDTHPSAAPPAPPDEPDTAGERSSRQTTLEDMLAWRELRGSEPILPNDPRPARPREGAPSSAPPSAPPTPEPPGREVPEPEAPEPEAPGPAAPSRPTPPAAPAPAAPGVAANDSDALTEPATPTTGKAPADELAPPARATRVPDAASPRAPRSAMPSMGPAAASIPEGAPTLRSRAPDRNAATPPPRPPTAPREAPTAPPEPRPPRAEPPPRRPIPREETAEPSAKRRPPARERRPSAADAARKGGVSARKRPGLVRRVVTNRWLRRFVVLGVLLVLAGVGVAIGGYLHYSKDLPSVDALQDYRPPIVTEIYAADGRLIGDVYEKQRYVVPYTRIPDDVVHAFVAAEDAQFFEHHGIDYMGIVRAMLRNLQSGEFSQGASTITQQVARSFLLTREKTITRKIKEAILAYRIEANFSKEYILYLYLNQIFLGHGAYGIEAASRLYFDKHVEDLSLPEAAMIAGLPQAPSNYSPNNDFGAAKARQRYVLDQMVDGEWISQQQADVAYEQKLWFYDKHDRNLDVGPYFVEHIRRYLLEQYGHDRAYKEGLTVYTTMDSALQLAANEALQHGVREVDHRVGLYEPFPHLESHEISAELARIDLDRYLAARGYDPSEEKPTQIPGSMAPALVEGELTRGVVAEVHDKYLWVDVGSIRGILHHADGKWAYKPNPKSHTKWRQIGSMRDAYEVGDLVQIRVINPDETWKKTLKRDATYPRLGLEQEPQVEAALLSMRLADGAVLAMVGGYDYEKSEFNRAIQANRQVGSTFKPLIYAAALDCNRVEGMPHCGPKGENQRYTPSSIIVDSPIVGFKPKVGGGVEPWKPGNAGGEFLGDTTLRRGLILSRNIVTLKIAQQMGINYTYQYVQRFGFDTELEPNLAMALGSSALTVEEMIRAYSVFGTLGDLQQPFYVTQIVDRDGRVLEEREAGDRVPDVMDEVTAYQMVRLMRDVVAAGTGMKALELGVPLQGKTGTTNEYRDAWFMGYNAEIVTGVWVGYDDFARSLGVGQYGGDCALPIWIDYMREALETYPGTDFTRPPGVEIVAVDSETGLLTEDGSGVPVAYRRDTAPTSYAKEEGEVDSSDFLTSDGGL